MERFSTLAALACPLDLANIDTDQLIPARFMKRSRKDGYGGFLLHDLRFDADGLVRPDFNLSDPVCAGMQVLVARRNFGTGSSREAAVYALWDFGIRCVIAPSFGDIFASNAVKNGLLPARVTEEEAEYLIDRLTDRISRRLPPTLAVDLISNSIIIEDRKLPFVIAPAHRLQLINGWDDMDLTQQYSVPIHAFRKSHEDAMPWAFPARKPALR